MKLTNEQKEANKLARAEAKKIAKETARIEAEKNQKPVKEISFSIEWKKSRMWGMNPHLNATCWHQDGTTSEIYATASGCGYDKESQVIADVFNQLLKYKLYKIEQGIKDGFYTEELPYGIYLRENYKGFSGGIGTGCYFKISEAIGGKFEKVASGKTYDAYKYTQS
jgi:hypothetical protein